MKKDKGIAKKKPALTKFQKQLVNDLIELGFKHKYFDVYEHPEYLDIDVSKIENQQKLIKHFFKSGRQQKTWEIHRVLEIPYPSH